METRRSPNDVDLVAKRFGQCIQEYRTPFGVQSPHHSNVAFICARFDDRSESLMLEARYVDR
nr:hypothetical protein [Sinorhizobium medicae]